MSDAAINQPDDKWNVAFGGYCEECDVIITVVGIGADEKPTVQLGAPTVERLSCLSGHEVPARVVGMSLQPWTIIHEDDEDDEQ